MSKHTPGPWEARKIPDGFVVKQTGGHGKYLFNLEECPGIPDAEANARLIAAAPDLLAACRAIFDHYDEADLIQGDIEKLRAAIAKAEGVA